jgi:thiol-disulfide isomerase/thioredoxin
MKQLKWDTKKVLKKVPSYLFTALLIFIVVNKDAKAWVLQQLIEVGLFKTELKKEGIKTATTGTAVPFSYIDGNGRHFTSDYLKDKVVFINFWATWCPPCLAEMPSLNKLYSRFKDDPNMVFLFINEDDNPSAASIYLQKKGYSLPVYRRGVFPSAMYEGTLPTTVILNKEGNILFKHEGVGGYNSDDFIKQLKTLE